MTKIVTEMSDGELREAIKAWHLRRTLTKTKYSLYASSISGQITDFVLGEEEVQELNDQWSVLKQRVDELLGKYGYG